MCDFCYGLEFWQSTLCLEHKGFVFCYKLVFMVYNSSRDPNNVGLYEYGIQTNLKLVILDLMTSKLVIFFSMQLLKCLCNLESLLVHLQLELIKYFNDVDVGDSSVCP